MDFYLATEDALSEAVGERLISEAAPTLRIAVRMGGKGNTYLKTRFPELANVSRRLPVLLLTDLDRLPCAPHLVQSWAGAHPVPENLLFRVVVREIETWLMADLSGFSSFFRIPMEKLDRHPEDLPDPKRKLLSLIGKYAKADIKRALLPAKGVRAPIGPGYNDVLRAFVRDEWSPERAAASSDSLDRVRRRLARLARGFGGNPRTP